MKGLMLALIFSSQILYSQNEIAIFYAKKTVSSVSAKGADAVTIAPFNILNGMIIVRASIDGVPGNYVLDTGAPGVVINSKKHKKKGRYSASSVGGALAIGEVKIRQFKWGIIEKKRLQGFAIDISHLESAAGIKLAGLIGYEVLKEYEVLFDYPNKLVKIYSAKEGKIFRYGEKAQEVHFTMNGHVPIIPVKVGSKKCYLGLDSGAEVNLLDESYFDSLKKSYLKNRHKEVVIGLDQKKQHVVSASLKSSHIKKMNLPEMKFLFMDLGELGAESGVRMDGLLGFPFFQKHAVSINYLEKKVYIWD
ncbi:MAG: aspartyl protease family protein [Bacteroidota bacterium]